MIVPRLLAIVIVNYCRSDDTLDCIESIFRNNDFQCEFRIVLIDNCSHDDSYSVFQKKFANCQQIILHRTEINSGYTGGFNRGIQIANSINPDWIFLLNNDTIVKKNAINELLVPDYDIVVPKILVYHKPELIWAAGARWRKFPPGIVIRGYLKKDSPKYNHAMEIQFATGCAIMLRAAALKRINGFDEDYESYLEDYDFFYKAIQLKQKILYQPKAIIFHKVSKTLGEFSERRFFLLGRNSVLFYLKASRYPVLYFYVYVIWFSIRETIKGHWKLLPFFIDGIRKGLEHIRFTKAG